MFNNLLLLSSNLPTHPNLFLSNLSHTIWEMQQNRYPVSWWLPRVKTAFHKCKQFPLPAWHVFLYTLPWIAAIPPKFCALQPVSLCHGISVITTPSLNSVRPLFPDAIPLKTIERLIFPPPSIAVLLPLIWVTHILPFCNAPLFCTALLLSNSVFRTTWPLVQCHHSTVPLPILHYAHFLHWSIPPSHFVLLMLLLRTKNRKRFIPSLLTKELFS